MSHTHHQDRESRLHGREQQRAEAARMDAPMRFYGSLISPHDMAWIRAWVRERFDVGVRPRACCSVWATDFNFYVGDANECFAAPAAAEQINEWIKEEECRRGPGNDCVA